MAKRTSSGSGRSAVGGGQRQLKQRVKTARGRKLSSTRWLERQLNDPYVAAAKKQGWRSRAAFKLIELDDKLHFLKPGHRIVDLGAAPGGWAQVAAKRVKAEDGRGQVIAIDITEIEPIPSVNFLQIDFMTDQAVTWLTDQLRGGQADVVLSDMAAPSSGQSSVDHLRIMALAEAAAEFALSVLAPGGTFVCKVLQGGTERDLLNQLKRAFKTVRHIKPPASRADSTELYVVATGFRGQETDAGA
ncbi:MAG: RlmE family RNA methyltransferase [Pseudomonadota bacterium]